MRVNRLVAPGAACQRQARVPGSASGFRQGAAMRRTTLVIWLLFFLVMFGFYFVMSWTPKLLVAAGLSAQQGITGGVLLSVGGILGAALIGAGLALAAYPRAGAVHADHCGAAGAVRGQRRLG